MRKKPSPSPATGARKEKIATMSAQVWNDARYSDLEPVSREPNAIRGDRGDQQLASAPGSPRPCVDRGRRRHPSGEIWMAFRISTRAALVARLTQSRRRNESKRRVPHG